MLKAEQLDLRYTLLSHIRITYSSIYSDEPQHDIMRKYAIEFRNNHKIFLYFFSILIRQGKNRHSQQAKGYHIHLEESENEFFNS